LTIPTGFSFISDGPLSFLVITPHTCLSGC
jgi:hypothetical protein